MRTLEQMKYDLEAYGYKLVTWAEFEAADDRPEGLMERASEFKAPFIVYDPGDDWDGWMLCGRSAEWLATETCRHIMRGEPADGPLSRDGIVGQMLANLRRITLHAKQAMADPRFAKDEAREIAEQADAAIAAAEAAGITAEG